MAGEAVDDRRRALLMMLAMGALYAGFGVMMGLLQGGLPPVLRARGMPLDQLALTYVLFLPLGLSFAWAPLVDRIRLPWLSPRIGWIVAAQAVAVAGVVAVALLEDAPLALLFGLGLGVAIAMATMDLALDALAVEMAGESLKPVAAALKLAALALGSMLGGGVFVGLLGSLGWLATFLSVAAFLSLSLAPVLGLTHADSAAHAAHQRKTAGVGRMFGILRQPQLRWRVAMLVVAGSVIFPLSAHNRVMLVDLGVPLERIAWLVGTLQPLALLVASLVVAPMVRTVGHRSALALLAASALLCVGLLLAAWHYGIPALAIAGTVGMAGIVGALMVVYATLMLCWAEGDQAATSYAVMFCGTRLAGMVATVGTGKLVAVVGWQAFYGLGAAALLLSSAWLLRGLRNT
ncbi:hypothetical protein [Thauera sp. Sel9]|uniref:hypothetical protein n=1 Tax=Thauera sp. Sel9 TaxID=2974299 RepID=UPI0021E10852|nr:hypothetical protein [Thauera sp. Sel9]MCV2216742.1 hypothetical protein [Thauera sp. Sel9]